MTASLAPGLVVAAPASASGKTMVAVGLIAAWRRAGLDVAAAKAGPDYIDTAFLSAAAGAPAVNLDDWAMREATLGALAVWAAGRADRLVIEGVMGLFDGAAGGAGSTAALARRLGLPVVLVIDAGRQAQSAAALAHGHATFDASVDVAGVILNRVSSPRHERLIREAFDDAGIAIFGVLPREPGIALPSRHLGLVQAGETEALDVVIGRCGDLVAACIDLAALESVARPLRAAAPVARPIAPPGQRIALAGDAAFAFAYEHLAAGWRAMGAEIIPFSPLAGEPPDPAADAVHLPGGYPELHAGRIAAAGRFIDGLHAAARRGAAVYGECGGYMVLGRGLVDADGVRHAMAGLLDLETSFAERRLHLGYRRAVALAPSALAPAGAALRGHEFHYATTLREAGTPLFAVRDAEGEDLGTAGLVDGRVAGSFVHLIDAE